VKIGRLPETDDMREAPALVLNDKILEAGGATVKAYDPIVMSECKRRIGDEVMYCKDMYSAAVDVNALLLVIEWKELRMPSYDVLDKAMAEKVILDGRNIYDAKEVKENGFKYFKIG
jgi:Predicted UDP-glucose 6-dehydrogenase